MAILTLGLLLFGGTHLFSIFFPAVRKRLAAWLGENAYKGLYSIVSLIGLVLMAIGYWQTRLDGSTIYMPYEGARHITMLLVLLGFILIASNDGKGYLRLWLQFPFSIGVALWASGHLLANGKTSVVLIYGAFLMISLLDIGINSIRENRISFEPVMRRDVTAVVAGIAVYAFFLLVFHPYVLGVSVVR